MQWPATLFCLCRVPLFCAFSWAAKTSQSMDEGLRTLSWAPNPSDVTSATKQLKDYLWWTYKRTAFSNYLFTLWWISVDQQKPLYLSVIVCSWRSWPSLRQSTHLFSSLSDSDDQLPVTRILFGEPKPKAFHEDFGDYNFRYSRWSEQCWSFKRFSWRLVTVHWMFYGSRALQCGHPIILFCPREQICRIFFVHLLRDYYHYYTPSAIDFWRRLHQEEQKTRL